MQTKLYFDIRKKNQQSIYLSKWNTPNTIRFDECFSVCKCIRKDLQSIASGRRNNMDIFLREEVRVLYL